MLLVTHSPVAAAQPTGNSCSRLMAWSSPVAETGATAWRWLIAGEFRAFPMRFVLAGLAIAIGVALAFAVHVINRSAAESFAQAVRSTAGGADLQVRAATALGFDESLYPKLMALGAVADASPVVQLRATVGEQARPLTLLGSTCFAR
jgi:putative ABC transport system permease protein